MKFAKELEDDLVPEWRVKYFNYKQGKKKIKAVSRALKNVNRTPKGQGRPEPQTTSSSDRLPFTHYDFTTRDQQPGSRKTTVSKSPNPNLNHDHDHNHNHGSAKRPIPQERRESVTMFASSPPLLEPATQPEPRPEPQPEEQNHDESPPDSPNTQERRPLQESYDGPNGSRLRRYGSIVGSPPGPNSPGPLSNLELPDPALDPDRNKSSTTRGATVSKPVEPSKSHHGGGQPSSSKKLSSLPRHILDAAKREKSNKKPKSKVKRIFSSRPLDSPAIPQVQLEAYRELDEKQDEFYNFLDKELSKIEKFYKSKEEEANDRLHVLRDQLHEMRDRRMQDMQAAKHGKKIPDEGILQGQFAIMSHAPNENEPNGKQNGNTHKILEPVKGMVNQTGKIGKTSKAMKELGSPQGPTGKQKSGTKGNKNDKSNDNKNNNNGDFVRKSSQEDHVPYRFAKRRLKMALQEFYRGLELLKSYALLNRTAFRKINKKYDKAVNARPTLQYMAEKVNNAHFVKSSAIEGHLVAIEDLYARYFERGNHKVAINKLRSKLRQGDQSPTTFRNGLYVAAGSCFGIAGLVNGSRFLFSDDPVVKLHTSYLLQIYAGYFLALLLFIFFVLDCRIWQRARVNYVFVFEYDTRHVLDWRQLAELPCFFLFLNGLFIWLNFEFSADHTMFLYWPVILLGISFIIIFLPFKILYFHSRKWFAYSNWRLLLAGVYPVEFRDFFMGDMYCSETYTLSQISLFFCIYAHRWNDPPQCNSNHSMLLGFFTTLPAVWRALQCLRRYYDTRNWFPHLANFAKYLCNILYYMTLSLYRLEINNQRRATFITFALINGVYCSLWDVLMDWSLGNPWARYPFLRDNLAYRRIWVYYFAMVADVVLRQQWVFYAIFTEDLQHSAAMSFFVGLAEVLRRGMWSLFRVENEHCNNVVRFRASRDVPLPYSLPSSESLSAKEQKRKKQLSEGDEEDDRTSPATPAAAGSGVATAVDLERARTRDSSTSVRQRKNQSSTPGLAALRRVGTVIAAAHSQDFQKKRRTEVVGEDEHNKDLLASLGKDNDGSTDDDSDDSDDGSPTHNEDDNEIGTDALNSEDEEINVDQDGNTLSDNANESNDLTRSRSNPNADPTNSGISGTRTEAQPIDSDSGDETEDQIVHDRGNGSGQSSPDIVLDEGSESEADQQNRSDLTEVRDRIGRARSPG